MTSIQWRPEINPLTRPQSYHPRHIPRAIFGNNETAALIAMRNPLYNQELAKGFLRLLAEVLEEGLSNGNQFTLDDLFTCHISFTGRMDAPDDPMPPLEESLQVNFYPSKRLVAAVRKAPQIERLPVAEKLPVMSATEDAVLHLPDVLNPAGMLKVSGADLFFDAAKQGCGCLIKGSRSGSVMQSRYGLISNSSVLLLPDIPAQEEAWNNEYIFSITTRYTENGVLRSGIYRRRLRTPLIVRLGEGSGILSGSGGTPLVTVGNGSMTAERAELRVQVLRQIKDGALRFNLIDMDKDGAAGEPVIVRANGSYTLPGFAGSALTSVELTVNAYADLLKLVRNQYGGRLVDIVEFHAAA